MHKSWIDRMVQIINIIYAFVSTDALSSIERKHKKQRKIHVDHCSIKKTIPACQKMTQNKHDANKKNRYRNLRCKKRSDLHLVWATRSAASLASLLVQRTFLSMELLEKQEDTSRSQLKSIIKDGRRLC